MEQVRQPKMTATSANGDVRIFGLDASGKPFHVQAELLKTSQNEMVLGNVSVALGVGDVIGVQSGAVKGKLRVQWIGAASNAHGQLGLEGEIAAHFKGTEAAPHVPFENRAFVPVTPLKERRNSRRYACDIGVQCQSAGSDVKLWGQCTDISEGGCYINSRIPFDVKTHLQLTLFLDPDQLVVEAVVRTSFQGLGMGLQMLFASREQADILRGYLQRKYSAPVSLIRGSRDDLGFDKLLLSLDQFSSWLVSASLQVGDRVAAEDRLRDLRDQIFHLRDTIVRQSAQR
jgi:hypothetical protein